MKERKELHCGTVAECDAWISQQPNGERMETVKNDGPGPEVSVFYKRVKVDRTIKSPITKECRKHFRHYRRPIVVTLLPGDLVQMQLKRSRSTRVIVEIEKLYAVAMQWHAFAEKARKRAERAAKRNARATA